jgi:hypothetical protein
MKKSKNKNRSHQDPDKDGLERQAIARRAALKNDEPFEESMKEDMRGPLEGMEAVPPKQ